MENFEFSLKPKIYFGQNRIAEAGSICAGLNMKKVMLVSDRIVSTLPIMDKLQNSLRDSGIEFDTYCDIPSDPDVDFIDKLTDAMKASHVDGAVALGGGSPLDGAKASCLLVNNEGKAEEYVYGGGRTAGRPGIPLVCIPTTAGTGSEITNVAVLSNHRTLKKASISSEYMAAAAAILDPEALRDAPDSIIASTGIDALTHAIEAYVCKRANSFSDMLAEKAIDMISENLLRVYRDREDTEAVSSMQLASTFASAAFSHSGLGAVHGIAQAMGGVANTAHGITNAVLLPYVVKVNYPGAPDRYDEIQRRLGMSIGDFCREFNIPEKTGQLGVKEEMIPKIVEETMVYRHLAVNPVVITPEIVEKILKDSL